MEARPRPKIATVELFRKVQWSSVGFVEASSHCNAAIFLYGAPGRSIVLYSAVRELSGTSEPRHAEATRSKARKSHRPPQAAGAQKALLHRDLARRLPGLLPQ